MHITKWKSEKAMYFQPHDISEKAKLWRQQKDEWLLGVREEGWIDRTQRIFRVVKPFCMILQWWIHVIIYLSKPIDCTTLEVNWNVNYRLWVIMMCQCRFTNCNKRTTEIWNVVVGEVVHVWEQGVYGNSLVLGAQFCCEPKTVPKISLLF